MRHPVLTLGAHFFCRLLASDIADEEENAIAVGCLAFSCIDGIIDETLVNLLLLIFEFLLPAWVSGLIAEFMCLLHSAVVCRIYMRS